MTQTFGLTFCIRRDRDARRTAQMVMEARAGGPPMAGHRRYVLDWHRAREERALTRLALLCESRLRRRGWAPARTWWEKLPPAADGHVWYRLRVTAEGPGE